jgi:hypothetical protein
MKVGQMIARTSLPIVLLAAFCWGSPINAQQPVAPGPFKGNRDAGSWEITTAQKILPASDERTTTKGTIETKVLLDGWFIESEAKYGDQAVAKSIVTADRDLKEFKFWYFLAVNNVLTTTGKWDDATQTLTAAGSDAYGNSVFTSDHRVNDDKRELTLVIKTKDGVVLVDQKHTLDRKKTKSP